MTVMLDSLTLTDTIARFHEDALATAKAWYSHPDVKKYRGGKHPVKTADVLDHFLGKKTVAVGPLQRAFVIDIDGGDQETGRTAMRLLLDTFGIPFIQIDSNRGSHTWVRCEETPTQEVLAAIQRLATQTFAAASIEVYPRGDRGIRLPFGVSVGVHRDSIPTMTDA